MNFNKKIYVAGHRGLVGSAIVRNLKKKGYKNIILDIHKIRIKLKKNIFKRILDYE